MTPRGRGIGQRFGARIIWWVLASPFKKSGCLNTLLILVVLWGLGVGAFFDFLGGSVRRAPRGWRSLRLEWLWRLLREPHRLWKRYLIGATLSLVGVELPGGIAMRILHVVRQYPPFIGGLESSVSCVAQEMAHRSHQITVVTLNKRMHGKRSCH